ncbi:hypothetical protein EYB33_09170 [Lysinibacillus sphaericus]|uniref:hypothetical protein n=1 Tax=Lysinibacillus sphaericus TaxID=1421 RepID=UPI001E502ECA|nr:hypothetical protein [Lysinibacillus sphaericus]UDK96454.1 hypothetical protein EYB33_09170 [Lysinibacillus sphaericus]
MYKPIIETFISRDNVSDTTIKNISITNPLAVEMAQTILKENEGDYLSGYVSIIYNDIVIFGEEQLTEDLLDTWCDLIYIFDNHYDGRRHGIVFLDNASYDDTVIKEIGQFYQIELNSSSQFLLPKESFRNELKKEFFKFVEFCKNEKLQFAEDSLYRGILETYDELLQHEEEKT